MKKEIWKLCAHVLRFLRGELIWQVSLQMGCGLFGIGLAAFIVFLAQGEYFMLGGILAFLLSLMVEGIVCMFFGKSAFFMMISMSRTRKEYETALFAVNLVHALLTTGIIMGVTAIEVILKNTLYAGMQCGYNTAGTFLTWRFFIGSVCLFVMLRELFVATFIRFGMPVYAAWWILCISLNMIINRSDSTLGTIRKAFDWFWRAPEILWTAGLLILTAFCVGITHVMLRKKAIA